MKLCAILLLVALATADQSHPGPFASLFANEKLTKSLKAADSILGASMLKGARHASSRAVVDVQLGDIYLPINDDTAIEFTNLHLEVDSALNLPSVVPDLSYLNLDLHVGLGNVSVTGDFKVASHSLLKILPVTTQGQIRLSLEHVEAAGKVGLQLGDSALHTNNYDLSYTPKEVHVTVTYQTDKGPVVSQVSDDSLDNILEKQLTRELTHHLNVIIQKNVDQVLESIPVSRLLQEDESLIAQYRNHARVVTATANTYVDAVLQKAREQLISSHHEEIAIPEIHAAFSEKVLWVTWHGSFTADQGFARNLASIRRTSDISISYDQSILVVFGSVGLDELKLGYNHYRAEFMGIGPSGTAKLSVGSNSVFLKAAVKIGSAPSATLQEVNIEYIKDIKVDVTGLGILTWLLSQIATWVIGLLNSTIVGKLNDVLHEYLANTFVDIDPNQFFN